MRRFLLALPFALLPLAMTHAADEHDHDHEHEHEHGSLEAHEHGVARLNAALDGQTLELELESPAMNLVGFEHEASTAADKKKVTDARAKLEQSTVLFSLPQAAGCVETAQELESPLFGDAPEHAHASDESKHQHSEIHASYEFTCSSPAALKTLDLTQLFKTFPATQKIQVQLIGPRGQQGVDVTPKAATLKF